MFSVCPASKETGLGVASIGIISFRVAIALKATALADYLVGAIPSARERPMPSGEAYKWFASDRYGLLLLPSVVRGI